MTPMQKRLLEEAKSLAEALRDKLNEANKQGFTVEFNISGPMGQLKLEKWRVQQEVKID